jgi:hypothetical protein
MIQKFAVHILLCTLSPNIQVVQLHCTIQILSKAIGMVRGGGGQRPLPPLALLVSTTDTDELSVIITQTVLS